MNRSKGLTPVPLRRKEWWNWKPSTDPRVPLRAARLPLTAGNGKSAATRKAIKPVSGKRRSENRERRAMAARRFPERPRCVVPWCTRMADDLHEILTRARGGSITDEENTQPVCRQHNEELTLEPAWGYELGLLKHSWDADGSDAA